MYCAVHRIEIHQVDQVINLLNNWGLYDMY